MIRFRRLFETVSAGDRRRFDEVTAMFRAAFPEEVAVLDRIEALVASTEPHDFGWVLLLAEDGRGRVLGFSFALYFPEIRYGYLYYIASHPKRRAGGIGGALYEATRELLAAKGARGLFLDAGPDELVYPEVFPIRRPERRPRELPSRAGYFCVDTFTPLTRNAWPAAREAVDAALTGADILLEGERFVYALCRPPGHHAERAVYGGFCYLNNAAIAAHALSKRGRVALLDIDYHHGNGSQDIFYARRDVYTISIHGTPNLSYPHFAGFDDERGEGDGKGFNLNYPLRRGVTDDRYMEVLGDALRHIRRFRADYLVLSLGFDIMGGDPTGSFALSTRGMARIAGAIAGLRVPTLIVQEGGYSIVNLRRGSRAFFRALGQSWY